MLESPQDLARAQDAGTWFAQRARHRELQLRRTFLLGRAGRDELPTLAHLIRGGRGGEVRLKLYLSILWVGASYPHDVTFPARTWAELLGLPSPTSHGARRVREAIDFLVESSLLAETRRPGLPTELTLLREDRSGNKYTVPGAASAQAKARGRGLESHRYVRLSSAFWSRGWIAVLTVPGLVALLTLLVEQRGPEPSPVWLAPDVAVDRYAISNQTRYRGLKELQQYGLVSRHVLPLQGNYEAVRRRHAYLLDLSNLNAVPTDEGVPG